MKLSLLLFLTSLPSLSRACDTTEAIELEKITNPGIHGGLGGSSSVGASAKVTFLPQDTGSPPPACLDGSPQGFYYVPSGSGNSTS